MSDGFEHITVTAAEDDDEVIVAGATEAPQGEPALPRGRREAAPAAAPEGAPSRQPARSASREDGYRDAALDDLEGESMPLAQRIVIVAAVICIIGALVYYFVAMR